jgi:hypothetical protein
MSYLNQIDHLELTFPKKHADPNESVRMECGRLIHAAVISRRFLNMLLTNPVKTIEEGYCGEKFAFTRAEKQRIQHIRASSLADFSSQLLQVIEHSSRISSPAPEYAFAQ